MTLSPNPAEKFVIVFWKHFSGKSLVPMQPVFLDYFLLKGQFQLSSFYTKKA